jgi:hypothetical protein
VNIDILNNKLACTIWTQKVTPVAIHCLFHNLCTVLIGNNQIHARLETQNIDLDKIEI